MKPAKARAAARQGRPDRITVENVDVPGRTTSVDRAEHEDARERTARPLRWHRPGMRHATV